jgi:hypothetical protein
MLVIKEDVCTQFLGYKKQGPTEDPLLTGIIQAAVLNQEKVGDSRRILILATDAEPTK